MDALCGCEIPYPLHYSFPLFLGVQEVARTSNTGVLTRLALGADRAVVLVAEVREHEEQLDQLLAMSDPSRIVIMFPSSDSIDSKELTARLRPEGGVLTGLTVRLFG